jgi:hypothetical protein
MAIQEISAKGAQPQPVPKESIADGSQDGLLDEGKLEKVFIGSIDQGTTSTRFIIFDGMGEVSSAAHVNGPKLTASSPLRNIKSSSRNITRSLAGTSMTRTSLSAL